MNRKPGEDTTTDPTRSGSKTLLSLAFAGVAFILVSAVVVALYTQDRLGTAVQRTTAEAVPGLLAALRLSERSALLAATTPLLSAAENYDELDRASVILEGLFADVDSQFALFDNFEEQPATTQIRESVLVMRTTLSELEWANSRRIDLAAQQVDALARIQKVHSELIDTVSPVVYGVSSLNNLFARRAYRQRSAALREIRSILHFRIATLRKLQSLSASASTLDAGTSIRNTLALLNGVLPEEDFTLLFNVGQSLLASEDAWGLRGEAFRALLSSYIERSLSELGQRLSQLDERAATTTPQLVKATTRDLRVAIDIKAEGNLLFALLASVTDVDQLDALAGLESRFNRSLGTFRAAARSFQKSPLAQRNPILSDNVKSIGQQLLGLGSGPSDPFDLRRQQLNLNQQILDLLATHRHVAGLLTQYSQGLVMRGQNDTDRLAAEMADSRRTSQWVLLVVSIGGVALTILIALSTIAMLERRERETREAQHATVSANRVLDAIGYSARRLLGSEFWEQAIDSVVARLGEAVDASRVMVYRNQRDQEGRLHAHKAYQWNAPGLASLRDNPMPDVIHFEKSGFSRWAECLERGETLHSSVSELPAQERPLLESHGVRSLLMIPIRLQEEFWGYVSFDDCEHDRSWLPHELEPLVAAADTLATAIARDRTAQVLRQAAIVFDSTNEGVLITDNNGTIVAANQAFTEISGYSMDEVIGQNPRMLKSDQQSPESLQEMWNEIRETGHWQGEVYNRRKDNSVYPEWLTIRSVYDNAGKLSNYVGVYSDITAIKETKARMFHLAHHDPLTDLPNRLLLSDRLEHAIQRARRGDYRVAVLFLDLDRFKYINDTLGHSVGDVVLREVSKQLSHTMRAEDTVARLGGDEFMIVIDHLKHSEEAGLIAQKVLNALAGEMRIENLQFYLTGSIGISIFPDDGNSVDELIKNADTAMYRAKEHGRNSYHYYTSELTANALEHFALENSLRVALDRDQFELHYQPQRQLETGRLIGMEALLRWRHPEHGLIRPDRFIPVAEDAGLMVDIGNWVLRTACNQAREWADAGLSLKKIAVNLSEQQITRGDLADRVSDALQESGLRPDHLELEITENCIMHQPERAIDMLDRLRNMGVTLAIDDFGTGHSSLSHLKRLPSHLLKIDQSFVRDMPEDPNDEAIARAIVAMGHALGLRVIAEGIENRQQAAVLLDAGCHEGQGFLLGYPVPAQEACDLLAAERPQQVSGAKPEPSNAAL